ncbi:ATP-binding protein [Streptomyces ficellus]|uniref:ATP-binding protein n=1 Tax=Streptomyces ficellus TaxID=1977088 RepID=A0ABT7ZAC2_9ACTN|nr:ATP-binding protein [Streptomyces ficellus]MDN3296454.1 ATP-binding protein [Streptomyces ficellus]
MTDNVVPLFKAPPTAIESTEETIPAPTPEGAAPVRVWKRTGRAMADAVTHERTKAAGRFAFRHTSYVVGGTRIVARRAWDGRTGARYERMLRAAEAAGNYEAAGDWEERLHRFRADRHKRRMDLLTAPERIVKGAAVGTAGGVGLLIAIGIALAVANEDVTDVVTPLMALVELIRLLVVIVQVVWGPLVALGPWLALAGLWAVGRHRNAAPNWALPASKRGDDAGAPITPSIVVTALRDLGIAPLRAAIKEMGDAGAAMLGPIRIAGCGVEVDVTLPSGVSTDQVQGRRRKLAENLNRHEHEVFITIPQAARTVRLWIADSGALDEPIGPSPLVTDPDLRANYKTGRAPWGQDLRGDAAALSLYQRHMLVTGLSNQGKTAAVRALALWLALDPTVEFRVADLKGAGDWAMFDGLATVLIQGPTDEHVIQATEMVESGVSEMERRLTAPPGTTFPPLIILVDEAQVAFMCPAVDEEKRPYGGSKATSRYFMAARKIHNQGRAVNVLLWQGTQDPTDQNLPKLVREGAHTRASLALGTDSQARMALGDKAVDGGAAPHLLRPGLDKGTLVVASDGIEIPAGQASITVRTHYIDTDQATEIADRAKALRDGVTTVHVIDTGEPVDSLADIASVIGDAPRLLTQDVLRRLAALNADAYGGWSFVDLKRVLDGTGAEPYKSDGRMVVGRDRIARALANRGNEDSASAAQ